MTAAVVAAACLQQFVVVGERLLTTFHWAFGGSSGLGIVASHTIVDPSGN